MIRLAFAALTLAGVMVWPAAAQERVTVATTRNIANAVLFLGVEQGHFKAEGLDVEMTAYVSDQETVEALAGGAADLGLAGFTAQAFNLAGSGAIKAIAAQVREKADYEGNDIVVSNDAYERGVRKLENLGVASFATLKLGTTMHYQLGQIARQKKFDVAKMVLKPQGSLEAISRAIAAGAADAAILPGNEARDLLIANQAKLVGWYSEVDEAQLGALFASAKTIDKRRATVEKFLRAYRRAAADYYAVFLRHDRFGKRLSSAKSRDLAGKIARYVFEGRAGTTMAAGVAAEAGIYYMDRDARLDAADIARQVAWYKSQNLVGKSVDAKMILDSSFK